MAEPLSAADDDLPVGLPRIDGDEAEGPPAEDVDGDGEADESDEDLLDEGGYVDEEPDLELPPEGGVSLDWDTAENEPALADDSLELGDDTSWVGRASGEGTDDLAIPEPEGSEGEPSALDAGEEGFDESGGADVEDGSSASELGAADDEGLDEPLGGAPAPALDDDVRELPVRIAPIASAWPASELVFLAADGNDALAIARTDRGDLVLREDRGTLVEIGRVGPARAFLAHPILGWIVATDTTILDARGAQGSLRAVALGRLGDGLAALDALGQLHVGPSPASLAPLRSPDDVVALAGDGAVLVVATRRGRLFSIEPSGRPVEIGSAARHPEHLAAVGDAVGALTAGGGAWARFSAGDDLEPEPGLRGATAIVALADEGRASLVGSTPGGLLRRASAGGIVEAAEIGPVRALSAAGPGTVIALGEHGLRRIELGPVPDPDELEGEPG